MAYAPNLTSFTPAETPDCDPFEGDEDNRPSEDIDLGLLTRFLAYQP